ncbi:hypothetical protein [Anaeromyxobacter paludicola]|uniref:Uncharacterized protein n=1 Tax=Anaeromyxobacter paludicola TaxID=2918171 RepID=A0ABM7X6Y4_9BACT|nr:hypothetical protein [Anaeromyxobacter paludicola]BDG07600.1 hypothetical protein AMPC_07130 [Anaeromyxobacter paludicola]
MNSDLFKKLAFGIGLVCSGVLAFAAPWTLAYKAAAILAPILAGGGVISGGTAGAQPQNVITTTPPYQVR